MRSNIITVSGPSAVGKTFFVEKITQKFPDITEVLGLTTRPKRNDEIDGKSGHFMTVEEMKHLEKNGKLILVKEFFGNKYAWFKSDLVNADGFRIINISYKSVKELKEMGLNIFSIFVRPDSEESIKTALKSRMLSKDEYEKRLNDYYESELFLEREEEKFDLIFTNSYNEKSLEVLLGVVERKICESSLDERIERLLIEDNQIEKKIQLAEELISMYPHEIISKGQTER